MGTPLQADQARQGFHHGLNKQLESLAEPHRYHQASAVELTDQLFQKHDQGLQASPAAPGNTSALPGGAFLSTRILGHTSKEKSTSLTEQFPGLAIPSRAVCDFLLQSYWDSVHWFTLLFHIPSFEDSYRRILDDQCLTARQRGTAVLILMVLTLGATYAPDEQSMLVGVSRSDLNVLQERMLNQIQSHFFDMLDTGGVECVQLCILLSTFHLYTGRPNLAMPILGAGIRSAQAQGLHKEALWGPANEIVVEVRRRTWWALYVFDRFASITYGRPPSISDSHCAVAMPRDLDDLMTVHPVFGSNSHRESNALRPPATLGAYQRHKFELYSIAGPIIGDIYDLNEWKWEAVIDQAVGINTKLVTWFDTLPLELRLESHLDLDTSQLTRHEAEVCRVFELQALVLQLAYDNIQIILHRPFLRYTRRLMTQGSRSLYSDARPTSFEQCEHCARRTCSIVPRYQSVLRAAQTTQAAAYIAIQNFTAGVTLGMVALCSLGSVQSLDAKRGVANSIALQKMLAASSVVSSQTVKVLKVLLELIFRRELQFLLGEPAAEPSPPSRSDGMMHEPNGRPRPAAHRGGFADEGGLDPSIPAIILNNRASMEQLSSKVPGASEARRDTQGLAEMQHEGTNAAAPGDEFANESPLVCGIDEALEFVQQVLWENSGPIIPPSNEIVATTGMQPEASAQPPPSVQPESTLSNSFGNHLSPIASMAEPASHGQNKLNALQLSQSWIWNPTDFS
ncbi:hypothetical protein BO82DRAFT_5958 [Aspergillus uvarum CBS 121591]|uniref:Xylanolytic transcriptional activator regulatory domain-containing protein n=1 Tax=Aspergillus uvarum CBS 121591 TaxID=1448315 RepID=A0A319CRG2_9EURO|nr:hypothetical protein BO82DRAFT_5958 [Aspergillus uvarum CBS 121591]PYH87250.1 hypothetical protein BO82DRAFT_5958 [Aspergillus uvarum CBS 121591]